MISQIDKVRPMPRPKSPWNSDAHLALQRLWNERIAPTGMTQEEFGARYGLGSQSMVSQYLLGTRPLHYDAAERFAEGFGCTIADISPDMAERLARDFFPKLGMNVSRGRLRRKLAGLILIAIGGSLLAPENAHAAAQILHNSFSASADLILIAYHRCLKALRWIKSALVSDTKNRLEFKLAV